jgi:hypothetical protein
MKSVFGVDFSKVAGVNDKNEAPLIEAWDYFKEKSKELSRYTDHTAPSVAA